MYRNKIKLNIMKKIDERYDVESISINYAYYYHRSKDKKNEISDYYSIKNYLESICTNDEISYLKDYNRFIYNNEIKKYFINIKEEELKDKNICMVDYDEIEYQIMYSFFKLNLNEVNMIQLGGNIYIIEGDDKIVISTSLRNKNLNKIKQIV